VDVDNVQVGFQAVDFLLKKGHRRIVYLTGPDHSLHSLQRLAGVKMAHSHRGVLMGKALTVPAGSYIEDGIAAGKKVAALSGPDRPTAIYCFNDQVALGAIASLRKAGLRVSQDVAVVGTDDTPLAAATFPPLTTVHIPIYDIGKRAAELLIRQIHSKENPLNERILLEARLVERDSA
jgi:LacI family transcriptional regulator